MSRDVSRDKSGTKLNESFRTPALLPFSLLFPEHEGEDVLEDQFEHPGAGRSGKVGRKTDGDKRTKLNPVRALQEEKMHAYMVQGSNNCVPHAVIATSNPDVSGFVNQFCRTPPRSTNAGDESVGALRNELGRGAK